MVAFDAAHQNIATVQTPFLPTDFGQYAASKAVVSSASGRSGRAGVGAAPIPASVPAAGPLQCDGFSQTAPVVGNHFPPEPHAAIGANHIGQVVNSAIRFGTKALTGACPTNKTVINLSLAAFVGYVAQPLFNPRILYDLVYNRWIVSVEAMPESPTVQHHFIMVSNSADPTLGFLKTDINITNFAGMNNFWDYPQIGYDEEAISLTGNVFNSVPTYVTSLVIFFAKHRLYAGLNFEFCAFSGNPFNVGTIAPNIVLDQGPYTTLATANVGASQIRVYKFNGTSRVCPDFEGSDDTLTTMFFPPQAEQPGSGACPNANCLDTLDGRFQNAGTQFGEPALPPFLPVRFWQVRTDEDTSTVPFLPTPLTYKINADALSLDESCQVFATTNSFDFNPSIVANTAGTMFLTWSATDPVAPFNAAVVLNGKKDADICPTLDLTGTRAVTSAAPLTGNPSAGHQAWGTYSSVTLDPADTTKAYGTNEYIAPSGLSWRTWLFNMSNP